MNVLYISFENFKESIHLLITYVSPHKLSVIDSRSHTV